MVAWRGGGYGCGDRVHLSRLERRGFPDCGSGFQDSLSPKWPWSGRQIATPLSVQGAKETNEQVLARGAPQVSRALFVLQ